MADVTYNTAAFPALIRTIASLVKRVDSTTTTPPRVLLGYKERDPDERVLWDLARDVGIHFVQIGQRTGAGGAPVEVWMA